MTKVLEDLGGIWLEIQIVSFRQDCVEVVRIVCTACEHVLAFAS